MPKRSSKTDPNVIAFNVVKIATDEEQSSEGKNPAAVALGRLGGLKGGRARALKLSKARRSQIAKAAAKTRWDKKKG